MKSKLLLFRVPPRNPRSIGPEILDFEIDISLIARASLAIILIHANIKPDSVTRSNFLRPVRVEHFLVHPHLHLPTPVHFASLAEHITVFPVSSLNPRRPTTFHPLVRLLVPGREASLEIHVIVSAVFVI